MVFLACIAAISEKRNSFRNPGGADLQCTPYNVAVSTVQQYVYLSKATGVFHLKRFSSRKWFSSGCQDQACSCVIVEGCFFFHP